MKLTFRQLMDKLGVPHEMTPYETYPFNVYDSAKGMTCSAEIRMGMEANEVEGEVQMMYDTPPEGGASMKQILWFSVKPLATTAEWDTKDAKLQGQPIDRSMYNWEEKCCNFFGALVRFLKMDEVPDMDQLIEEEFHSRERFGGGASGGGGKSPKIKPGQLLGMKKGQGF